MIPFLWTMFIQKIMDTVRGRCFKLSLPIIFRFQIYFSTNIENPITRTRRRTTSSVVREWRWCSTNYQKHAYGQCVSNTNRRDNKNGKMDICVARSVIFRLGCILSITQYATLCFLFTGMHTSIGLSRVEHRFTSSPIPLRQPHCFTNDHDMIRLWNDTDYGRLFIFATIVYKYSVCKWPCRRWWLHNCRMQRTMHCRMVSRTMQLYTGRNINQVSNMSP